jgi:hypothetical protein
VEGVLVFIRASDILYLKFLISLTLNCTLHLKFPSNAVFPIYLFAKVFKNDPILNWDKAK